MLAIVTAENAGKLGKGKLNTAKLLGGPEIQHYHQAIALVVAETFEQARAAAQLVRVDYARPRGASTSPGRQGRPGQEPSADKDQQGARPTRRQVGDFDQGGLRGRRRSARRDLHHPDQSPTR